MRALALSPPPPNASIQQKVDWCVQQLANTSRASQVTDPGSTKNQALANMAPSTIKGQPTTGDGGTPGPPVDLTPLQVNDIITSFLAQGRAFGLSVATTALTAANSGSLVFNFNANRTVNLPNAANGLTWAFYTLDGGSGGNLTINVGSGSLLFQDGTSASSVTMVSNDRCIITSDGTNWIVFAGTFNGAVVPSGAAAQGDILYFNGTRWVRLPAGTANFLLGTGGAGANPAWTNNINANFGINASGAAADRLLQIQADSGHSKNLAFEGPGFLGRWIVQCDSTAESGSDAGSNFQIQRYHDNGSFIDTVIFIQRSNGFMTISDGCNVNGGFEIGGVAPDVFGALLGVNTQSASYTLIASDAGKTVEMNVAGANTLTVPPNVLTAPCYVNFTQLGAGQTTITPGAGVTLRARIGLKTAGQNAIGTMYQRATNDWVVGGDVSA